MTTKKNGKPKGAKTTKATKGGRQTVRKAGAQTLIKTLVLKDPTVTTDALMEQVGKAGYTVTKSTVATIRRSVLDTLRVMHAMRLTSIPALPAKVTAKPKPKGKGATKPPKPATKVKGSEATATATPQ